VVLRSTVRFLLPLLLLACGAPPATRGKVDLDPVLARARRESKHVILDFSATWCPPCRQMEADVWPDDAVKAELSRFLFVTVDVDENPELVERYHVNPIPDVRVLAPDGHETGGFVGARKARWVATFLRGVK
jgi:thioredoxin-like negative regulator of GroEL